jgi:hypothetical protein
VTNDHTFRVRCKQIISSLDIPQPFHTEAFLAGLAAQRGRRIELIHAELIHAPLATGLPCGMLVATDEIDYIVHRTDTTVLHAQHADMHEVGHVLLGHSQHTGATTDAEDAESIEERAAQATAEALHLLLPDLSPRLIRRILGRTVYGTREEWEAETFASELMLEILSPVGHDKCHSFDLADDLAHLRATTP